MDTKIKTNVQILLVLILTATLLILLSVVMGGSLQQIAAAQEPATATPAPVILNEQTRAIFDQVIGSVQVAAGTSYNLQVSKIANPTSLSSGNPVTFTVTIRNNDSQPAWWICFQDDLPAQLQNVKYQFNTTHIISDNLTVPTWLFTDPINPGQSVVVTITGKLVSARLLDTATNIARAFAYTAPEDVDTGQASVSISNASGVAGPIYLPIIRRDPTPTPTPTPPVILAYEENFDDDTPDDNDWLTFSYQGCTTTVESGRYKVTVDKNSDNRECLPPARNVSKPEKPFRTYGEFETAGYHSEGQSDAALGIFINGEGGSDYYLFKIYPNDDQCSSSQGGSWRLIRRQDNDETTLLSENCNPIIKRGYNSSSQNILKIRHTTNRTLSVYVNGQLLGSYQEQDSNKHLTGTATGIYIRRENVTVVMKFDYFKVYKLP